MPIEISKKKWQDTRPERDCKGTGMGKVADDWKATCTPVVKLLNPAAILNASVKNGALHKAIEAARPIVKKSTSDKKKATVDLLDDWDTQVAAYARDISSETLKRQHIARETMRIYTARANKIADDAIELTKRHQLTLTEHKNDMKNKVAALQMLVTKSKAKGDPDGSVLRGVGLLVESAGEIQDEAAKLIETLRRDVGNSGVAPLRRGGQVIAKENNLDAAGTKQMIDKYNLHKELMDKFELDIKTVGLLFKQVSVDSTAVEQLLKKGSDLKTGYKKILEKVLSQVEATKNELGAIKSPTSKTWTATKPPGNDLNIVEQQIAVQTQVIAKWGKAQKRLDELLSKGVGYVPAQSRDDPDLRPLLAKIESEVDEFQKVKTSVDKENVEANVHLSRLVDQLS